MDEAEYGGLRFAMQAYLDGSVTPLKLDISTGDIITPCEILFSYKLMFEDRDIAIMAYPIETVLAEKIETMIARSVTNTRMRDFYDIHVLLNTQEQAVDQAVLSKALAATSGKRGSTGLMENAEAVLTDFQNSTSMQRLWESYQKQFAYATPCSWYEIMWSARKAFVEAGLPVEKPSIRTRLNQLKEASAADKSAQRKRSRPDYER